MVRMCLAPPLVQQTIKLPQILLLNSSGGGFSDQGPLAFASGFQGLQVVGLVCKSLATAFRKSATLLKRLVRRNLTLKLLPFTFDEEDFSKLLREHKVDLVGTFPYECVSGLKTPIIDMLDKIPEVAPYFCHMKLNVLEGEHADALCTYLRDNNFWKPHFWPITRPSGFLERYFNSANVQVMVFIIYKRASHGHSSGVRSFLEARFNGDCFTIWRPHSTGT